MGEQILDGLDHFQIRFSSILRILTYLDILEISDFCEAGNSLGIVKTVIFSKKYLGWNISAAP